MSRLVRIYPAAWRDRYEEEFVGLLAERQPTFIERFDIVRGAVDARLHPQVRRAISDPQPAPQREGAMQVARLLGIGAVIGAALWPAAWGIALMGPVLYDGYGSYRDGSAALPVLLASTILIALGMVGQAIRLPGGARFARLCAVGGIPLIVLFGLGPWFWPLGLGAVGCVALLAASGLRAGAWPGWAAGAVIAACLSAIAVAVVGANILSDDRLAGIALFAAVAAVLVPVWLGLGATLIRRPAGVRPT
jgi:hypothetical protein